MIHIKPHIVNSSPTEFFNSVNIAKFTPPFLSETYKKRLLNGIFSSIAPQPRPPISIYVQ